MINYYDKILSLIGNVKEIQNNVGKGYAAEWVEQIKKHDEVCIFGAGEHGGCWYEILKKWGVQIKYFCDNDSQKWNQNIVDQISCIAPDDLKNTKKHVAVIVALRNGNDVVAQIKGWANKNLDIFIGSLNKVSYQTNYEYMKNPEKLQTLYERMQKVIELCEDERSKEICYQTLYKWLLDENYPITYDSEAYFYTGKFDFTEKESLVDVGAYDGDTIENFLKVTDRKFEKVYAFEMDKRNYDNLQKNIQEKPDAVKNRVELYQLGISDTKGEAYYKSSFQTSKLSNQGTEVCHVDSLDALLGDKRVTMIKMDIEGGEKKALKGGENLIRMQHPKLAICIYHSIDDFLDIPIYLKTVNPGYRIFLRHHTNDDSDTVCYAY